MSNQHILYNTDLQIIIYIHCQRGLPDNIPRHFTRHHGEIPLKERKEIKRDIKGLKRCSIKEVSIPTKEVDAIEGIEIIDGFKCIANDACQELYGTLDSMIGHCRDQHEWIVQKRNIFHLNTDCIAIEWVSQKIQTIFAEPNVKYFPVRESSSNSSSSNQMDAFFDNMRTTARRKDDECRLQRHKIINDESIKDTP